MSWHASNFHSKTGATKQHHIVEMGSEGPHVQIKTSLGAFEVELYNKHCPKTCKNFLELSRKGYYNNTVKETGREFASFNISLQHSVDAQMHRIIADFMIQAGDPTGTGRGGECIWGGKFEDEIHPELHHTGAGILSMANAGPNTNGSQFFITLNVCQHLDGKHAIFGRVCSGMGTVKRIGNVQTDANDRPTTAVTILSATVLP